MSKTGRLDYPVQRTHPRYRSRRGKRSTPRSRCRRVDQGDLGQADQLAKRTDHRPCRQNADAGPHRLSCARGGRDRESRRQCRIPGLPRYRTRCPDHAWHAHARLHHGPRCRRRRPRPRGCDRGRIDAGTAPRDLWQGTFPDRRPWRFPRPLR